jgi:hypothetical protein
MVQVLTAELTLAKTKRSLLSFIQSTRLCGLSQRKPGSAIVNKRSPPPWPVIMSRQQGVLQPLHPQLSLTLHPHCSVLLHLLPCSWLLWQSLSSPCRDLGYVMCMRGFCGCKVISESVGQCNDEASTAKLDRGRVDKGLWIHKLETKTKLRSYYRHWRVFYSKECIACSK